MEHKNFLKCGLLAFLLTATVAIAVADPVWVNIVDMDLTGRYYQYFIDKDGDGIEDGVVEVSPKAFTASLFRRYMQVGGKVLYENDNRDDFIVSEDQLLRILLPDGRTIRVVDFAGQYHEFRRARDYEAQQQRNGR